MGRELANLFGSVELKIAVAAITGTTSEAAVTDVLLNQFKEGAIGVVTVSANDDVSGDETYVLTVEGRDSSAGVFATVGGGSLTITRGAASNKIFLMNIDEVKNEMRVTMTVGGTTPSIVYQCVLICPATHKSPAVGLNLA